MLSQRAKAKVKKNMDILRKFNMPLTDREYAILAVSVTELEAAGYTPYESKYPIQVDPYYFVFSTEFTCFPPLPYQVSAHQVFVLWKNLSCDGTNFGCWTLRIKISTGLHGHAMIRHCVPASCQLGNTL